METKKCNKCGVVKPLCEFAKNKSMKDGHLNRCKDCYKIYYQANKEQINKRVRAYKRANKEKIAEQGKAYNQANKEKIDKRRKAYREANREKLREKAKVYRENNKQAITKRNVTYVKRRRREDPIYRLRTNVSSIVGQAIRNQGKAKGGATFSALPYTPSDLVEHIERQFDETMTWDNYGSYWEIDHIYPQSLLPYDSLDHPNFQKCWDLDNLQPLEKIANRRKSNKVL